MYLELNTLFENYLNTCSKKKIMRNFDGILFKIICGENLMMFPPLGVEFKKGFYVVFNEPGGITVQVRFILLCYPLILCFQEIHLFFHNKIALLGYTIFRHDHVDAKEASGGLDILVFLTFFTKQINRSRSFQAVVVSVKIPSLIKRL